MRFWRLWALLPVMVWCLAGCGAKNQTPATPTSTGFTAHMTADYNGMAVAGKLIRTTAGTLEVDFTAPETLNGLKAIWDGEEVTLTLKSLSFKTSADTVPGSAIGSGVSAVLDTVLRGGGTREVNGNEVVTTGKIPAGEYKVVSDKDSGALKSLSIPALPLEAAFSDFQWTE